MTIVISILTYRYSSGQIIAAAESGAKTLRVKGIAWGGGGAGINRVDVSIDNGKTFTRVRCCTNRTEFLQS